MLYSNFWNIRFFFIIFALVMTLTSNNQVSAEDQAITAETVEIVGTGNISGKNIALAKEQAIANGLASSVQIITLKLLQQDLIVKNFPKINEIIFDRTNQFIQGYKVLSEVTAGKSFRVILQATISGSKIKEAVSGAGIISLTSNNVPNVLILIAEQNYNDKDTKYWWGKNISLNQSASENGMSLALKGKGFNIIDPKSIKQNISSGMNNYKAEIDDKEALEIGRSFKADIIIIGKANVNKAANSMASTKLSTFKSMISAHALSVKTEEKIAKCDQTATMSNSDEIIGSKDALSHAGSKAGEELVPQLTASWSKTSDKAAAPIEIFVEGTNNFINFVAFRKGLSEITGVNSIQLKETKLDTASILVDYKGDSKAFSEALMLKTFEKFGINISEISQNSLKVKLIPN